MAIIAKFPPLQLCPPRLNPNPRFLVSRSPFAPRRALAIRCAKRTGKQRYPSEKKQLRQMKGTLVQTDIRSREEGFWRLSKLGVPASKDPGKDFMGVSPPLLEAIAKVLKFPVAAMLPQDAFSVVRKSFDARKVLKEPEFVYTVDMDVKILLNLEPRAWDFVFRLEPKLGLVEYMPNERVSSDLMSILLNSKQNQTDLQVEVDRHDSRNSNNFSRHKKPKIAVVGSGPSGLFASLVLGELGAEVTLIERGQAVERRGRDIGALVARRLLQPESNFCFGEREFERKAAIMGGGNFVVPAQTVTDFLDNKLSVTSLPPSSYRMGVQASNLHELLPTHITQALQHAIFMFDKELPGFISKDALLHGVETRTSSPVQIRRHRNTYESTSLKGLYPIGEGAGYAGGIVSAAVDGMYCGFAIAKSLNLYQGNIESILGQAQKNTGFVKY